MKLQDEKQLRAHTSDEVEIQGALALGELLAPCLKVDRTSGRVMTSCGDKTLLGLYRTIKARVYEKHQKE